MNIGLYFGSFNPIHIGHLIIANYIANAGIVNQVWFVVSPHNPLKPQASLLNEQHRLSLVNLAIENEPKLKASNVEFGLPKPSYTADTLAYLTEKYPQHNFTIIMGSDSINNIEKWKNYQYILNNYNMLVYQRPGFPYQNQYKNATIINAPLLEISSTTIRQLIKEKKSIKFLVPDAVLEEINNKQYYSSALENKA
jgi:nicotinate-nucleotide adenylyltransferase